MDSLNVARNIGERSFFQLLDPLSYEQSTPLLFLWLSKCITNVFGISHYSLRLVPLLAGVTSLFLFADIARKVLRSPFSVIALFWFGTHQLVARYATEYKQYMVDVFATLFVIWIVIRIENINKKNWWKLALGGVVIVWISMPVVFVIISALIYLGIRQLPRHRSIVPYFFVVVAVILSFIANYVIMLRPTIGSVHMQNFHNDFFLIGNIFKPHDLMHDLGLITEQARMLVGKSGLAIASVLIAVSVSIFVLAREKRMIILLFILPIMGAFGASLIGKYSILERLMLFSLPLSIILVMIGVEYLYDKYKQRKEYVLGGVMVILTVGLMVGFIEKQSFKFLFYPYEHEDNRSSLMYISDHKERGRDIICTQHAYPAYDYYTQYDVNYKHINVGECITTSYNSDISSIAAEKLNTDDKVWILANHYLDKDIDRLIRELKEVAVIENSYRAKHSAAIFISKKVLSIKE